MGVEIKETRLGGFTTTVRRATKTEKIASMGKDAVYTEADAVPEPGSRKGGPHVIVTVNGLGDPVLLID